MNTEQEIEVLKRQIKSLRVQIQQQGEWLDTVNSFWVKRVWWFLKGFHYHKLGRWYNKDKPW